MSTGFEHKSDAELKVFFDELRRLRDSWRDWARSVNDPRSPSLLIECADELDNALDSVGELSGD